MTAPPAAVCWCGHPETAHEHFRVGSDCAACRDCEEFRPVPADGSPVPVSDGLRRTLLVLGGLAAAAVVLLAVGLTSGARSAGALLLAGFAGWMVYRVIRL